MVLAAVGWSMANDMLALNKTSTSATITVEDENDFGSVVDQLKTNNIIEHTVLFRLFAAVTGGRLPRAPMWWTRTWITGPCSTA